MEFKLNLQFKGREWNSSKDLDNSNSTSYKDCALISYEGLIWMKFDYKIFEMKSRAVTRIC